MSNIDHRISTRVLRITDAQGKPLAGKQIRATQTASEFKFGCGIFEAVDMLSPGPDTDVPALEDLVEKWLKVFNYGTLPFYWGRFEKTEGDPQTESRMKAAKYLKAKGVPTKGHPLCWHTACADWLMEYDNKTILDKQLARINREVAGFRGVIDIWDVVNEAVIMPIFDKYDNAITRICKDLGRVRLIKEMFEAAHAANPDATLLLNDFNLSDEYQILIDGCLNAGVPISAIGLQTHQHQGYMGPEKLEKILKRFEVFGLPLHFTENTIISGELMPPHIVDLNDWQVPEWPTTPEYEERQRRELEAMITQAFEHPLVEAFTCWDFADDAWLHAPAGLIRTDNSLKPSYHMLDELVNHKWKTDVTLVTDENGCAELTGFRGTYELNLDGRTAKTVLAKVNAEEQVIL